MSKVKRSPFGGLNSRACTRRQLSGCRVGQGDAAVLHGDDVADTAGIAGNRGDEADGGGVLEELRFPGPGPRGPELHAHLYPTLLQMLVAGSWQAGGAGDMVLLVTAGCIREIFLVLKCGSWATDVLGG